MRFELGKYYNNHNGCQIHICGLVDTHYYGQCLVGENRLGVLSPVGTDEEHAFGYVEITKDQFIGDGRDLNE